MISLMNENGLMELEIEKDGMRIERAQHGGDGAAVNGPGGIERVGSLSLHGRVHAGEGANL